MGQWENAPYFRHQDADDYAQRSGQTVFKKRVSSALLSVLVTKREAGSGPALAPVVGALGSGFAGAAVFGDHAGIAYAFREAGIAYSSYFGKALCEEFRPDITFLVNRMVRKRRY